MRYHIAFMCFVPISDETATSALYSIKGLVLYNQGGECLLEELNEVLQKTDSFLI